VFVVMKTREKIVGDFGGTHRARFLFARNGRDRFEVALFDEIYRAADAVNRYASCVNPSIGTRRCTSPRSIRSSMVSSDTGQRSSSLGFFGFGCPLAMARIPEYFLSSPAGACSKQTGFP